MENESHSNYLRTYVEPQLGSRRIRDVHDDSYKDNIRPYTL